MGLTYRSDLNRPLTNTEIDDNFRYFTGSHAITGSLITSGSSTVIGTSTLSGSVNISGSVDITGSLTVNGVSGNLILYKTYVAKITQTETNEPVVIELENNLNLEEALTWTRRSTGRYATNNIPGNIDETTITCGTNAYTDQTPPITVFSSVASAGPDIYFEIRTYSGNTPSDSILESSTIEIRIYP